MLQCSLYFSGQEDLLTREALGWITQVWKQGGQNTNSYNYFLETSSIIKGKDVDERLKQGRQSELSAP